MKMIELHDFDNPYMILGENVAVPHAEPIYGVNKIGISLLIVKNGTHFSKDLKIHFIFIIAVTGTEEHITAIHQLSNIAMDKRFLEELKKQTDEKDVYNLLKNYIKDSVKTSY